MPETVSRAVRVTGLILLTLALLILNSGSSPIADVQANTGCPGSTNAFGVQSVSGDCTITGNTVWGNGTLTLAGNLTVNSGATLTLWSMVIKFSGTAEDQMHLVVNGVLRMVYGSLQSNNVYHWYLISYGSVQVDRANISYAGYGAQAGVDLGGSRGSRITYSRLSATRVEMLSNQNDYFAYNNLSNYDDSANGNNHVFWIGANSSVEHNTFWNITLGTQSAIMAFRNYGNIRIFANNLYLKANGNNAMGIEVINLQPEQTTVCPTSTCKWLVQTTWNNITWYSNAGGSNSHALDNEYSDREWIANNTVRVLGAVGSTECLQAGGMRRSLVENNACRGPFAYGIYDYIYDTAFNTFRHNTIDKAQNGVILQSGNNTFVGNAFTNLTGSGIWECSSSPCAGSSTATTHNLYAGNTFTWQAGSAVTGNLVNVQASNYLANVFVGHAGPTNPATRYRVGSSYYQWNGDWLYWGNAPFRSLRWSNNTNGSRCFSAALPSLTAIDCKALGTALLNSLSVAGPIDQHGSADIVNNPRQATVLYRLGRDTSTLSLKTAHPGRFWFNVTGDYYGTYRVNVYNYSGSKWENFTTLYTNPSGSGTYSRAMSGFYNISIILVNVTAGGSPPPTAPPSVTTNPATNILQTGATLNGQVTSLGTASSVEVGFLWGTSSSLSGAANVTAPQSPLSSPASFTYPLAGLSTGTVYFFEAWANGQGFAHGGILSFTTGTAGNPPSIATGAASFVGQTSATLNGNLTSLGSASSVQIGFLYGINPTLSGAVNVTVGTESSAGWFSFTVVSLSSGATYYVQAWAEGTGFADGGIASFATLPTPPAVATFAATAKGQTTATLNGNLATLGSAPSVTVGFLYGQNASLSGTTNVTAGSVTAPGSFSAALQGLTRGATYYFRAWANGSGFMSGGILNFTATNPGTLAPRAITKKGTGVHSNLATVNGNVSSLGSASAVNVGFLYGTSPTLSGAMNVTVAIAESPEDFNLTLTGLTPGTTYYFEAWAAGQSYALGGILNFTTTSLAPVVQPSVLGVTYTPGNQQLDVLFSQPMDRASVESAISIQPAASFAITWLGDNHLQLQLGASMSGNAEYTLTIAPTARDSNGMAMGDPFTFQFTVSPASSGSAPSLGDLFSSSWLPWITIALAAGWIVALLLYRRSRRKLRALRRTARLMARRIEELRAAGTQPSSRTAGVAGPRPVRTIRTALPKTRLPESDAGNP